MKWNMHQLCKRIIFTEPSPEKSGDVGEKILGNFLNYKHFN
jgi:imidazoleglycerol phosphate synthase glutamine amidotransferase subunit HisH